MFAVLLPFHRHTDIRSLGGSQWDAAGLHQGRTWPIVSCHPSS